MYAAKGPFKIIRIHDHGSYEVQPYGKPNAATRKYKADVIELLPPILHPCEPQDTTDQRYLNLYQPPVRNPLNDALGIKKYDDTYFLQSDSVRRVPPPPEISNDALPRLHGDTPATEARLCPKAMATDIESSEDKLFFISYRPMNTVRPHWYLVQVNPASTKLDRPDADPTSDGIYTVDFLVKHSRDLAKPDHEARWWLEWHCVTQDEDDGELNLGDRVEFRPSRHVDLAKYTTYSASVDLCNPDIHLIGPFDYSPAGATATGRPKDKEHVPLSIWNELLDAVNGRGIQAPFLSTQNPSTSKRKSR